MSDKLNFLLKEIKRYVSEQSELYKEFQKVRGENENKIIDFVTKKFNLNPEEIVDIDYDNSGISVTVEKEEYTITYDFPVPDGFRKSIEKEIQLEELIRDYLSDIISGLKEELKFLIKKELGYFDEVSVEVFPFEKKTYIEILFKPVLDEFSVLLDFMEKLRSIFKGFEIKLKDIYSKVEENNENKEYLFRIVIDHSDILI
jgi:hypothetical protein